MKFKIRDKVRFKNPKAMSEMVSDFDFTQEWIVSHIENEHITLNGIWSYSFHYKLFVPNIKKRNLPSWW